MALCHLLFALASMAMAHGGIISPSWSGPTMPMHHTRRQISDNTMDTCMQPVLELGDKIQQFPFTVIDMPTLNRLCPHVAKIDGCLSSTVHHSGSLAETDTYYKWLREILPFMCSPEGKEGLISEASCWRNPQIREHLEHCMRSVTTETSGNYCTEALDLRHCFMDVTVTTCNTRAAKFLDKAVYHTQKAIPKEHMPCDIPTTININSVH